MKYRSWAIVVLSVSSLACGSKEDGEPSGGGGTVQVPEAYSFPSRFTEGDSVNYSGQVARQVLVLDLTKYVGNLTDAIESGTFTPSPGDSASAMTSFYEGGTDALTGEPLALSTTPPPLQATYDAVSGGKNLSAKIAGNDAEGQHKDWTTAFAGWSDPGLAQHGGSITSPDGFVKAIFATLDKNAVDHANAVPRIGPTGETLAVHQTANGIDLAQLLQKFLLMAVNFSQGTDDYLDDDLAGKGLNSDNTVAEEGEAFSALEHGWDEGFGYFGAARDYGKYSDEEIAAAGGRDGWATGYHDTNGDGSIDLTSEHNFGASTNAAKRDLGAVAPTDFTGEAWGAFLKGRAIISGARGALNEQQMAELKGQRDIVVLAWEKAISATVVHYINEVLANMLTFGQSDYSFGDHAEHWSEMKGFALGLQFNRLSPLESGDFVQFHQLVGDAPVLPPADSAKVDSYKQSLIEAREILRKAYGFDQANMGDDNGKNGW